MHYSRNQTQLHRPFGSTLQAASDGGHEAIIRLLLDKDVDVNVHAPTRGMACSQGDGTVTRGRHGHKGTAWSRGDGMVTRGRHTHEGTAHEWMAWYVSEGRCANKWNYSQGHVRQLSFQMSTSIFVVRFHADLSILYGILCTKFDRVCVCADLSFLYDA